MTPEVQTAVDRALRLLRNTDHRRFDASGLLVLLGISLSAQDASEFWKELDRLYRAEFARPAPFGKPQFRQRTRVW